MSLTVDDGKFYNLDLYDPNSNVTNPITYEAHLPDGHHTLRAYNHFPQVGHPWISLTSVTVTTSALFCNPSLIHVSL